MAEIIKHTYQFKRGTAQRWLEVNPILLAGEPGFEDDTGKLKLGDGFTPWAGLPYINEGAVFNGNTRDDFPYIGLSSIIYKAQAEAALYQWNEKTQDYELLSAGEQLFDELVKDVDEVRDSIAELEEMLQETIVLYGGSATDNIILLEDVNNA